MRILFVTPYSPAPPDFGGASRMFNLIREIASRHDVTTLIPVGPNDATSTTTDLGHIVAVHVPETLRSPANSSKRLRQLRSILSVRSFQSAAVDQPAIRAALTRLLRDQRFDIVHLETSQTGVYLPLKGVPTVLGIQNVEHDVIRQVAARTDSRLRRLYNEIEWRKLYREEKRWWSAADGLVVTSDDDAQRVWSLIDKQADVVPNGVDESYFKWVPLAEVKARHLVFVGAMRYEPNADGARYFVGEIWPKLLRRYPDATLSIVGADPPPDVVSLSRAPGVSVTGTVPDVRPEIARSRVVIVPLRQGGGTRLKILEAFASGRPVVSTVTGAEGIDAEHGRHLLLADEPDDFVDAIGSLFDSVEYSESLVAAAWELMHARYRWSAIAQQLERVYVRLSRRPG